MSDCGNDPNCPVCAADRRLKEIESQAAKLGLKVASVGHGADGKLQVNLEPETPTLSYILKPPGQDLIKDYLDKHDKPKKRPLGRPTDPCPCKSGKTYAACCWRKKK